MRVQIQANAQMQQQQQNVMQNVMWQQQVLQPAGNVQIPGQIHPGAADAVMTQQQQNARNKKER